VHRNGLSLRISAAKSGKKCEEICSYITVFV